MIVRLRREYGQFITSGAQLLLLLIGAKLESRTGWLVCVGAMAAISLVAWLSTLRRRRAIADTPTSRIASAAQGYVELRGTGRPLDEPPLLSHLTSLPDRRRRCRNTDPAQRKLGPGRAPLYGMETADQRSALRARRISIDWRRHA